MGRHPCCLPWAFACSFVRPNHPPRRHQKPHYIGNILSPCDYFRGIISSCDRQLLLWRLHLLISPDCAGLRRPETTTTTTTLFIIVIIARLIGVLAYVHVIFQCLLLTFKRNAASSSSLSCTVLPSEPLFRQAGNLAFFSKQKVVLQMQLCSLFR